MFVGRERELSFFEERYQGAGSQLIVLYGRRRVGKTETLREFCKNKPHVFFSCIQSPDRLQLARFSSVILSAGVPAARYVSTFPDWEQAFRTIGELPFGNEKKLVVLDEFPYMCEENKAIPSILQVLWDTELQRQNVMIVLCGSALSFIEKELLADKNPLYGRTTGIYRMREMGFYDAVKFFPRYSSLDKVLAYSSLGGVPHYLRQWSDALTVEENIKKSILTKGSILYSETEFLLHQELRETRTYNAIIAAVALGSTRLNEIDQKAMIDNASKTSVYLKNLMELGIVEREFPVGCGVKGQANAARGLYRLTDNYFRFWYAFCFGNYSQLEDGDADGVLEHLVRPVLHTYAARTFEDVCLQFVKRLQRDNRLPFRYARLGRWWGKTSVRDSGAPGGYRTAETEIDLLAVDPEARQYLVGECKFKKTPFSRREYLDVAAKLRQHKDHATFYYALFSQNGFEDSLLQAAQAGNLHLYDLDAIVNYEPR